jgi:hypothetical protein
MTGDGTVNGSFPLDTTPFLSIESRGIVLIVSQENIGIIRRVENFCLSFVKFFTNSHEEIVIEVDFQRNSRRVGEGVWHYYRVF